MSLQLCLQRYTIRDLEMAEFALLPESAAPGNEKGAASHMEHRGFQCIWFHFSAPTAKVDVASLA